MKNIKRILTLLLLVPFVLSALIVTGCREQKNLVLKVQEINTCRGNGHLLRTIVDLEESGISESTINVSAGIDGFVWVENGWLKIGNKLGKEEVTLSAGKSTANIKVNVLKKLDYYQKEVEDGVAGDVIEKLYYASKYLINNMSQFKNPDTVEVMDCWGSKYSSGGYKFFVYKIRAMNGFGGYSIEYYKTYGYGLTETTMPQFGEYDFIVADSSINDIIEDYYS